MAKLEEYERNEDDGKNVSYYQNLKDRIKEIFQKKNRTTVRHARVCA